MILSPYSFNGTSLNSTDYDTSFPRASALLQMKTNPSYVKRAGAPQVFSGKDYEPFVVNLEIICQHDFMTLFESLNQLFDTKDETPRQFICQDTEDSNKQYYVYATAKQVTGGNEGNMAVVTLALDDPIWQSVSVTSQTFSSTAMSDSTSVTNAGNDYAYPIFEITPTSAASTDYSYHVPLQVIPTSILPWPNRFLDITGSTDTTFDTAALVAAGKMLANGDDLRVFRDGVEVDRWLNGINTTDTHVIVSCDMPPVYSFALKTAIGSTDTVTEIELVDTPTYRQTFSSLPSAGRLIVCTALGSTDTEEFSYTAKTITGTKIAVTVNSRAIRNTVALGHSANHLIYHVPYDFTLAYGFASETAPTLDTAKKPLPALTSRNWSLVFTNFFDAAGKRPNSWIPNVQVSNPTLTRSGKYTSTDDAGDTDPGTAMGLKAQSYQSGGTWLSDSVSMFWQQYFGDYVSSVSASGEQKQNVAGVPSAFLMALPNGLAPATLWTLSEQSSSDFATFTAWSKSSSDATLPPVTIYLRWAMYGAMPGSTDYYYKNEIDTITVGLTNYPDVRIRSEVASSTKIDLTLTNSTTGDSIRVIYLMPINDTLIIDTDPNFPTAKYKGQVVNGAVSLSSTRAAWMKLNPGTNTITYQTNLTVANDVSIVIKHNDRMNFF